MERITDDEFDFLIKQSSTLETWQRFKTVSNLSNDWITEAAKIVQRHNPEFRYKRNTDSLVRLLNESLRLIEEYQFYYDDSDPENIYKQYYK